MCLFSGGNLTLGSRMWLTETRIKSNSRRGVVLCELSYEHYCSQCYPDYILLQWVGLFYYTCAYWESTWAQNSLKSCACLGYKDINSGLGNWVQIAGDQDGALSQSLALCSSGSYSIPWVSWFFWSDSRQPFFCVTFSNKKILQSVNRLID